MKRDRVDSMSWTRRVGIVLLGVTMASVVVGQNLLLLYSVSESEGRLWDPVMVDVDCGSFFFIESSDESFDDLQAARGLRCDDCLNEFVYLINE